MPKSRKRRRSSSSPTWRPPDRPYRSITSQMTPAYDRAVREAADAELRGDAAEALRLHRSVPMFRQSTHGERLQQLADLGPTTPGWMINRWLTLQARRRVWTGCDESAINRVLQLVVPLVYPDGIQIERIGCTRPEQVIPFINERDWAVRQADVYDLGAPAAARAKSRKHGTRRAIGPDRGVVQCAHAGVPDRAHRSDASCPHPRDRHFLEGTLRACSTSARRSSRASTSLPGWSPSAASPARCSTGARWP